MSDYVIKVPDLGEGIVEAELVAWHVAVGDKVAEDQVVADVMTDKATVEIPSPVAGRVLALGGEIGGMLRVGGELIRLATGAAAQGQAAAPAAAPSPAPAPAPAPAPTPAPAAAPVAAAATTAAAAPAPATTARAAAATPPSTALTERPIASPSVRRRAWELGLDLRNVRPGTPSGRILHADLDAAVQAGLGQAAPASPASPLPPATPAPRPAAPAAAQAGAAAATAAAFTAAPDNTEDVPVIGLRRRIALQMQQAKQHIPHFSYVEEVDVTELEALRARLNATYPQRPKLTLLPFLMRAMVVARAEFAQINARFDDEKGVVHRHHAAHIGVAAQTPSGLMVPVVRHAEALDLWGMAAEVSRLAEAARTSSITRGEMSGSTITITSLGPLGGIVTTPIINRPEVAIVGVNRIVERLVPLRGMPTVRLTMNLSSSFDHRVVDGMDAARYVQALRAMLEAPATLFIA